MSMPDLDQLFDQYNEEYFADRGMRITKIPVEWNTRLRTTAGRCHPEYDRYPNMVPVKIDMNFRLFQKHDFDMQMIKDTLIHEMAHAALIEHRNNASHDDRFQYLMIQITGEWKNHRCHSYDTEGLHQEKKVEAHCNGGCGIISRRARMPKRRGHTCRSCHSTVTWVDNRTAKAPKSDGVKLFG